MGFILVVDDNPAVSEPIAAALQANGYQSKHALNGAQAMTLVLQERPDLIILDLGMPGLDGFGFLQALRKTPKCEKLPIIILTSHAERAEVERVIRLGVRGYMLKSRFSLKELLDKVRSIVAPPPANAASQNVATDSTNGAQAPTLKPSQTTQNNAAKIDPTEAVRSLKPIVTRSELTDLIDGAEELKGFSPVVAEVLKLTGNTRCSIEHIAKAIGRDHAIALKVLKLANSAVYTRGEPVDSVQKAVMRIGLGQIRQAVLNIAVIERFSGGGIEGLIESGQFWEHAIATGIIAAEIAHTRSEKEADSAFTMGLLHDVGRMVFVTQLGERYREVVQTAGNLQLPLEQVEHRMLCFNHADVMDRVFRKWGFGTHLINPIVFHHLSAGNIRQTAAREINEVATLALANRLAHAFMLGSSGNQAIYPTEDLCELLKLDPAVIARIEHIARDETDKVKFALLANSNQPNWAQLREVHRQALSQPLRPLYVSSTPAFDAHRIFVDQLTDRETDAPPNLGVISLRNSREKVPLTQQYRAKELEAGVQNLPLLVISPNGTLLPEAGLLNGRQHASVATPFVIPRFIAAVDSLLMSDNSTRAAA